MAKLSVVPRSTEEAAIDAAFAALLDRFIQDPVLVRRVPTTLFVFKKDGDYVFRLSPGHKNPVYLQGVILVTSFELVEATEVTAEDGTVTKTRGGVKIGHVEDEPLGGVMVSGLGEAARTFGPLAVAMFRSFQIKRDHAAAADAARMAKIKAEAHAAEVASGVADLEIEPNIEDPSFRKKMEAQFDAELGEAMREHVAKELGTKTT